MRTTDEETIVLEKTVYYNSQEEEVCDHGVTQRRTGIDQKAEAEEELWVRTFTVVSAGKNGQGRVGRFRIQWCE